MKELTDRERILRWNPCEDYLWLIGDTAKRISDLSENLDGSDYEKNELIKHIADLLYFSEMYFEEEDFNWIYDREKYMKEFNASQISEMERRLRN